MQEKKDDVEEAVGIKGWEISLPPLGEGKTLKKIISCLPQQKKRRTRKCMHSPPTKTNSWRCRQTRRELISSPTRRGLQGERGGREGGRELRKIWQNCILFFFLLFFFFQNPCVACRPAGPSSLSLSLAPLSLPKACFSLSPALPLHQSPSASPPPLPPFFSADGSLRCCLCPLRCCRCVTSSWAASGSREKM